MKTLNRILTVVILAITFASCSKNLTFQERKDLAKGDLLYKWKFVYYINTNHDTTWAKNEPALQDDWIVFYAGNFGYIEQGEKIFYPGKKKETGFHYDQISITRFKLTSWEAGVYPNGQTWFTEGFNNADLHGEEIPGEGKFLFIVETYPNYQEWKYQVTSD